MSGVLKVYNSSTSTWETVYGVGNSQYTLVENQVPTGIIDGSNTTFTLPTGFVASTLKVYKNGVRMKPAGDDYTATSTGFTMTSAPATGTVLLCDYALGDGTNIVGGNSLISDEVPTGTVNGTNKTFTTARGYVGATLEVFINGVKQTRGTHFTETTPSSGTFDMSDAPLTGDNIMVNYSYNLNPSSNADTVDGYNANATPTANTIPVLDANATLPQTALQGTTLGYSQATSNQTGITTETDITGLSVTVTVPAGGRRVKVTGYVNVQSTVATDIPRVTMYKDGNAVQLNQITPRDATAVNTVNITFSEIPTAGSHTYKLTLYRIVGTGNLNTAAASTYPAFIMVELV